jgi:hypothetical protein
MGRYRRDPETGDLSHLYAVERLSIRLRKALGDWAKNDTMNGDSLAILRDALVVTLGANTVHAIAASHPVTPDTGTIQKQQK